MGLVAPDIAAVIFDMDGVIVDSEPLHIEVETALFAELGLNVTKEEHLSFVGTGSRDMWNRVVSRIPSPPSIPDLMQLEEERYLSALERNPVPLIPGIVAVITELQRRGLPLALASSSTRRQIGMVLEQTGLASAFDCTVSGDEVPRSKPAPEVFLKAAACLGVEPQRCLVIEDSAQGVTAGNAAGMFTIALVNPGSGAQDLSLAHHRISTLEAVLALLE